MKIRSLLLGSVAAAGLSTGAAHAADLGVLTSLDVCDALGLSGLTISSDTNCLQITGEVKYKFVWGDFSTNSATDIEATAGTVNFIEDDGATDWQSRFDAWIKFVATADSDFGPAKAVLKLKQVSNKQVSGYTWSTPSSAGTPSSASFTQAGTVSATFVTGGTTASGSASGTITVPSNSGVASSPSSSGSSWSTYGSSNTDGVVLDEAYVAIGDSTMIMAGKKGSILNKGDDVPLNWLGLFNSEKVDAGVKWSVGIDDGGHVIQVVSDLGNGVSAGFGLENLNGSTPESAGTAVGVLSYAGDGLSAHVSFAADGVLSGTIQDWGVHAGFAGTFDNFKIVAAGAFDSDEFWNVLASASATFDMFTIAGSVEATSSDYWGAGASISAAVTDTVTLNVGGRWAELYDGDQTYQVAASITAAVTDSLSLTGEVGYVNDDWQDLYYGSAKLAWAPGGGYTSSVKGTITSDGGYKLESEFKKTFE